MDRLISRVDDAETEAADAGRLVHIFQTGTPQTQALSAMNFPEDKVAKRVSIALELALLSQNLNSSAKSTT